MLPSSFVSKGSQYLFGRLAIRRDYPEQAPPSLSQPCTNDGSAVPQPEAAV